MKMTMRDKKAVTGYLFILPFIIGFLVFFFPPIIQSLKYCFNDIEILDKGFRLEFVGLKYFKQIFIEETGAREAIMEDIQWIMAQLPIILIFSMFVAILLNAQFKGRTVARIIFFLPVIITSGIILKLETQNVLQQMVGMEQITITSGDSDELKNISVAQELIMLLRNFYLPGNFKMYIISAIDNIFEVVKQCGVQVLIFLSGLQSIAPSLYEAADIEGATGWENFWKITFPMVSPLILANGIFTFVQLSYNTTGKVQGEVTRFMGQLMTSKASAIAWSYFIIMFIVMSILISIVSKMVFYQE